MKQLVCQMCGSPELYAKEGYFECGVCGSKFTLSPQKNAEDTEPVFQDRMESDLFLAKEARVLGNYLEALACCQRVLNSDEKQWEAWLLAAQVLAILPKKEDTFKTMHNAYLAAIHCAPEAEEKRIRAELDRVLSDWCGVCLESCYRNWIYFGNFYLLDFLHSYRLISALYEEGELSDLTCLHLWRKGFYALERMPDRVRLDFMKPQDFQDAYQELHQLVEGLLLFMPKGLQEEYRTELYIRVYDIGLVMGEKWEFYLNFCRIWSRGAEQPLLVEAAEEVLALLKGDMDRWRQALKEISWKYILFAKTHQAPELKNEADYLEAKQAFQEALVEAKEKAAAFAQFQEENILPAHQEAIRQLKNERRALSLFDIGKRQELREETRKHKFFLREQGEALEAQRASLKEAYEQSQKKLRWAAKKYHEKEKEIAFQQYFFYFEEKNPE